MEYLQIYRNMNCDYILTVLKDTAAQLDFRVTTLEENGGSGNSSVAELEVRVETLEVTVSDQETRLTSTESELEGMVFQASTKIPEICFYIKSTNFILH